MSDVVIIGVGARTPLGRSAMASATAALAGVCRIQEHPVMRDKVGEPFMLALDGAIVDWRREQRMIALAGSATQEAMAGLGAAGRAELLVYICMPEPGPFFTENQAATVCASLSSSLIRGHKAQFVPVMEGDAAGIAALEQATHSLLCANTQLCLIIGVDSLHDPEFLESLDNHGRLRSTSNRWGFPPGEGAGALVLCNATFARQYQLPVLAKLIGIGSSRENNPFDAPAPCTGEGLARAIQAAAQDQHCPIGRQYCDINGDRHREHEFSYAVLRLPASLFVNSLDYDAPADCWGHAGAASALLLALLPIVAHARTGRGDKRQMIWCGSDNGYRGAFVLELESRGKT